MTALMLVNLMPVGALAEGMKLDSNSVQSRASKKSANVYVYVKVTGDTNGLTINPSGWYTIGKSENVPGMGTPYWSMHGSHSFSDVGVSYKTVLKTNFTRWTDNQKIDLDQITWTEFYVDNGADDYVKAGTYTWHMNGTIDIKQLPSVYTIKYVDYDTKKLIASYEKTGLMGQASEDITAPDSLQENLYSFYFVKGHPQKQTVDFTKDKGELTFYYKKNTANYTVNYYLNGTKISVDNSINGTAKLGETVTKSPVAITGYTPVSNDEKSITIGTGTNEINFYYYKNVELTANSATVTYDGNVHSVSGFTGAPDGADFRAITVGAAGTNVGTYTAAFADGTVDTVDATGKYIVTKAINGTLKITPVTDKVVVTITENSASVTYDGKEHTVTGYKSMTADNTLYNVATSVQETPTEAWTAKGTNVGEYPVGIESKDFKNTNANFSNVEFVVVDGKLEITPATAKVTVTITGNKVTETYDGSEKTAKNYTVSIDNDLYTEDDFTFTGEAEVKATNAGTYDMGLNKSQFKNKNNNFSDSNVEFVVNDGKLEIEKRVVTLTSEGGSKVYDGTALTKPDVTIGGDGFVAGEVSDVKATGSVTYVSEGEVTNTITYTEGEKFNADNYDIQKTEGKLSITPLGGVVVTIKGQTKTVTYDGEEHTAWKYDVIDISDPLYIKAPDEVPNFWNKNAKGARGTDAGTYAMGWEAADFENNKTNF